MNVKDFATLKAYQDAYTSSNVAITNMIAADGVEHTVQLKRVQFETYPDVVERLETVCHVLGISKREFLERALVDALDCTWSTFTDTYHRLTGERRYGDLESDQGLSVQLQAVEVQPGKEGQ